MQGTLWAAIDREFVIEAVKTINEEVWIFYKNTQTGQQHSCLQAAFLSRFMQVVNNDRK